MKQIRQKPQIRRHLCSILFALILLNLCTVKTTYAWESLTQTAVNITAGTATKPPDDDPDDTDKPDIPDKPSEPDKPDTPDKPSDSDKPDKNPEPADKPQKPSKNPDSSSNQTGKADADTGDTHQFLTYMSLMLASFILMTVIGVSLIILTINTLENRRN